MTFNTCYLKLQYTNSNIATTRIIIVDMNLDTVVNPNEEEFGR